MNQHKYEISLKKVCLDDLDYLLELRKLTMVEHLKNSGIFYNDAQHKVRIMDSFDCFYLLYYDNDLVGAIKFYVCDTCVKVMQLQIHPQHQKKGIGKQAFEHLFLRYPHHNFELSVLKFNPAKTLYLRLGFEQYDEDEFEFLMRRKSQFRVK